MIFLHLSKIENRQSKFNNRTLQIFAVEQTACDRTEWVEDNSFDNLSEKKNSCIMASIIVMVIVLICNAALQCCIANATGIAVILKLYFWEKFDKENEIFMIDDKILIAIKSIQINLFMSLDECCIFT